jgi:hypothetical protein
LNAFARRAAGFAGKEQTFLVYYQEARLILSTGLIMEAEVLQEYANYLGFARFDFWYLG